MLGSAEASSAAEAARDLRQGGGYSPCRDAPTSLRTFYFLLMIPVARKGMEHGHPSIGREPLGRCRGCARGCQLSKKCRVSNIPLSLLQFFAPSRVGKPAGLPAARFLSYLHPRSFEAARRERGWPEGGALKNPRTPRI